MKRQSLVISSSFLLTVCLVFSYSFLFTNSSSPPAKRAGSPISNGTTCAKSGCHDDMPAQVDDNGVIKVDVRIGGTSESLNGFTYSPNTTYFFTVNLNSFNKSLFGFQMTALNDSNQMAGSFQRTNTDRTSLKNPNNVQYIAHKNADSDPSWGFEWVAPSSGEDSVTFYIVANGADNSGNPSGDEILKKQITIKEEPVGIGDVNNNRDDIHLYPNPVKERFSLQFDGSPNKALQINLLNMNGEHISALYKGKTDGSFAKKTFNINNSLASGMYMVEVIQGDKRSYKKLLKQ